MNEKNSKKIIIGIIILLAAMVLCLFAYQAFGPKGQKGIKSLTVQVVHKDGSVKDYSLKTGEEFLGPVLLQEKIAEGETGPFGLFITTVDGERADDSHQEWWRITKSGQQLDTGADTTPVLDGDAFEITLTTGY